MGVATVALTVRDGQALVRAGGGPDRRVAVVAPRPVAALMFRYNNPDALLTLLLVGAAYATLRASRRGRTRWLLLAGAWWASAS